jgi:murein DD-endopeptidase MepM/ murein hydrolase activator NlpD
MLEKCVRPIWLIFFLNTAACLPAAAADLKVVPADYIVLNPTNRDKHYSDLVVHTIAIATGVGESATLASLRVDVLAKGQVLLTREVPIDELVGGTQYLAHAPLAEFVAGQVLNADGIDGLFGRHISFADSAHMAPSQTLLAMRMHFSAGFKPDMLRATAMLAGSRGKYQVTSSVPVHSYVSPIAYQAPLEGEWLMQAIPGVQSHHRFSPPTEFALDFFKLGTDGHIVHGDPLDARNFYGYGALVLVAAAGTVTAVIADQKQDRAALTRRAGESREEFGKRVEEFHLLTMRKNFRAANAGNLVTIRHEKDGVVEYSSYGHLKAGSVRLKVGDLVTPGDVVGEVGDTGDSNAVHLHFQINAGADAFTSKSVPVAFANMHTVDGNDELGSLVAAP